MPNLIQIKRSLTNSTPTGLSNGELAFTANGNVLFIGSPNGSVVAIGGLRTPGVLTANHALVANATSFIDKINVANLVPTQIYANGGFGSSGQILASNGTSLYWSTPVSGVAGSNTQVQFNDSGVLSGDADFTFDKSSNTLTVGAATINSTNFSGTSNNSTNLGGQAASFYTNATNLATGTVPTARLGSGTANSTTFLSGDQSYKNVVTSVASGSGLAGGPVTTTGTLSVLANNGISANATGVYVTAGVGTLVNSTGVHVLANNGITANTTGVFVTQGTGTVVNATGVHVNSTYIGTLTANNATNLNGQAASFYTNASNLSTGTVPTARLGSGTANSTTFLSGDQSYKTAVTSVASGSGLTGGSITTTGTLSVLANNGISANATGIYVVAGTGVTVNATGVHIGQAVGTTSGVTFGTISVTGNSALGDATSDVISINGGVNTNIIPTANVTYGLGNNTLRWSQVHVANVHSVTGKFDGNVEIAGNLTVTGSVSNVSVTDLVVSDPLIHIGANNETSDLVDLGFVGHYSDDGGTTKRHAGLFRDATDGEFKLFTNLVQADLDTANALTINTAATSYRLAILQTYLESGALLTNSSVLSITSNSTVNVAIVANTLTLTTALSGNSGGTGRTTSTNNALLVGNTTNGYNELTLGTDGYVLQSNGSALIYSFLDGGTF